MARQPYNVMSRHLALSERARDAAIAAIPLLPIVLPIVLPCLLPFRHAQLGSDVVELLPFLEVAVRWRCVCFATTICFATAVCFAAAVCFATAVCSLLCLRSDCLANICFCISTTCL